ERRTRRCLAVGGDERHVTGLRVDGIGERRGQRRRTASAYDGVGEARSGRVVRAAVLADAALDVDALARRVLAVARRARAERPARPAAGLAEAGLTGARRRSSEGRGPRRDRQANGGGACGGAPRRAVR